MADWHVIQPQVRTARKRHRCDDCPVPIEPGDRYQLLVTPPNRDDYGPRNRHGQTLGRRVTVVCRWCGLWAIWEANA